MTWDNDTYLSNDIYCRYEKLLRFSRLFSYLKFGYFMGNGILDGKAIAFHIVMENKSLRCGNFRNIYEYFNKNAAIKLSV